MIIIINISFVSIGDDSDLTNSIDPFIVIDCLDHSNRVIGINRISSEKALLTEQERLEFVRVKEAIILNNFFILEHTHAHTFSLSFFHSSFFGSMLFK